MESPQTAPGTSTFSPLKIVKNTFHHILVVICTAFVVATLFTAWADPGLLPGTLQEKFSQGIAPQTTNLPADVPTSTPRSRPLVGIVAGHSGNDSGAVCTDGLTEVSVNQRIAAYVQQYLSEKQIDVDLLNEFDPKLIGYKGLALISVHADSCDYVNDQATGFKVTSALASTHPERAARLTACLRNRYSKVTGLPLHNSITTDMTSYHAFSEIHGDTTAAIVEVGFLNLDRQLLTQQPEVIARGIVDGITCFIYNEDIPAENNP